MEKRRIKCPDSHLNKEERIKLIIEEFRRWVSDEKFIELIHQFGNNMDLDLSTIEKIKWLKEKFVDVWDYRRQQKSAMTQEGESARWLLRNSQKVSNNEALIYSVAERLGLIGNDISLFDNPDYYLPLGGARMSNLRRCQIAKNELSRINFPVTVVALAGMRPINESEKKGYIDTYAPNALTEYDAMVEGMKNTFYPLTLVEEKHSESDDPNLSYDIKQFKNSDYKSSQFYTVAAPSTVPGRRANSADCFKFFFEEFTIPKHSKLVNCTSQIYCSYQQVRALFFAIDYEVEFDTIGFPYFSNSANIDQVNNQLSEPVNYLQEIKGTIDAMYDFIECYETYLK